MRYQLIQLGQLLAALSVTLVAFAAGIGVGWLRWGEARRSVRGRIDRWLVSDEQAEREAGRAAPPRRGAEQVQGDGRVSLFAPETADGATIDLGRAATERPTAPDPELA